MNVRMLRRVYQHYCILIEQAFITFDLNHKVAFIPKRKPSTAVGQHVGLRGRRIIESRTHALTYFFVPRPFFLIDIDASRLPKIKFGAVGAGTISARDKGYVFGHDLLECSRDVLASLDASRIALGSNEHKVIVHNRIAFHAVSFGQELLLRRFRMNENNVCTSAPCSVERLTGAKRDHFHSDAGLFLKEGQNVTE